MGIAEESNSDNILFKEEVDDESDVELPDARDEMTRALGLEQVLWNLVRSVF